MNLIATYITDVHNEDQCKKLADDNIIDIFKYQFFYVVKQIY